MVANLTQGTPPKPYGQGGRRVFRDLTSAAQVWQGAMVAESAGQVVTATTAGSGPVIGVAEMDGYGSTGPVDGTDDSQRISILYDQIFEMSPDTSNPPTEDTPFGTPLYATSDNTVGTAQSLYPAGLFQGMTDNGNVYVMINPAGASLALLGAGGSATPAALNIKARAVVTSLPETYTNVNGVLTAGTHAAFGTQDGVTLVAGDVVFLPAGIANSAAASDEGPYVVTSMGGSGAFYVLTRCGGWETGVTLPEGASVDIGEGTIWAGVKWKSFAVKGSAVVDTNDPSMYPDHVTVPITLGSVGAGSGAATVAGIPIRSTTKTGFAFILTGADGSGSGTALTVKYATGAVASGGAATAAGRVGTAGSLTQATVSVTALVAAGTYSTSDVSTGLLTIMN